MKEKKLEELRIKDEDLESVSGGYIFDATKIDRSPETFRKRWEVIDDNTGEVKGAFDSKGKAVNRAEELGLSQDQIDWDFVKKIKGKEMIKHTSVAKKEAPYAPLMTRGQSPCHVPY